MSYEVRVFVVCYVLWLMGFAMGVGLTTLLRSFKDSKDSGCCDEGGPCSDFYYEEDFDNIVNMVVVWNFWPYDWETQGV